MSQSAEESLLAAALGRPPAERAVFLDGACYSNPSLRQGVEALLAAQEAGQGETLPSDTKPSIHFDLPDSADEIIGTTIGRYKLREKLGEGGCGVVYVAEQEQPVRRRVALKVIKLGMDTKQVVARFEAERQALAMMDHPNIAKVLDGGTTESGRPYFVMELVRGIRITDYCDQNNLGTKERLDLFMQVCHAIQHAHQKGIIHRDIKPSNILVTLHDGVPVPKVIDFGIAKATEGRLTEATVYTQLHQFIGTPAYMSPEQAEMSGLDIDTRSDIYSLGVLLYELLTGKTPFDAKELIDSGIDAMRKTIREKEPVRPSTRLAGLQGEEQTTTAKRRGAEAPKLIHLLRGDLDWVVMKCLEKDRTRRYETANGIAADLKRHLTNEPVVARPPSTAYRFQKLIRRNKLAVAAVVAVASALVLGVVVSTWQAIRARKAESVQSGLFQEANKARANEVQQRRLTEANAQTARQNLYAADMLLAQIALEKGNLGRLRQLLAKHVPERAAISNRLSVISNDTRSSAPLNNDHRSLTTDLRGWEWRYLWNRSRGQELFVLSGHTNEAAVSIFHPDGKTVITCGHDQTLRFWNLETRTLNQTIHYPDKLVTAALSSNGQWLVIGGERGSWSLWDVPARRAVLTVTNSSGVIASAFAPENDLFAIGDLNEIQMYRVDKRRKVKTIFRNPANHGGSGAFVYGLAFSPDGKKLAYMAADHQVLLHDVASGSDQQLQKAWGGESLGLKYSPDGRFLVAARGEGIKVHDLIQGGQPTLLTNHLEQVVSVDFSPDGRLLVSASGDQTLKIWETITWKELATLRGHEHEIHTAAFSPDGNFIVSGSKDETVRVWRVQTNSLSTDRLIHPSGYFYVPFRPTQNQQDFLQSSSGYFQRLNLVTLEESAPREIPPWIRTADAVAVDSGLRLLAIGLKGGSLEVWSQDPLKKLKTLVSSNSQARSLWLGESGRWLLVKRVAGETELWDIEENRVIENLPRLEDQIEDGDRFGGASFWAKDRLLARVTSSAIEISWLADRQRKLIRHHHKNILNNYVISEDGNLLATSSWDGQIKLWEVNTGKELANFRGQLVGSVGLVFSPDNTRLAAGGWDGTITFWDVTTHQQVAHWQAHSRRCVWLCFVDNGGILASRGESDSGTGEAEIRLWRAPSWVDIEAAESKQGAQGSR